MASLFGLATGTSAPATSSTRPLVLQRGAVRLSVPIPSSSEAWISAEVIREAFYHAQGDVEEPAPAGEDDDAATQAAEAAEAQVKLLASFIAFVNDRVDPSAGAASDASQILRASVERFDELFLRGKSVHTLTQAYAVDDRASVLTAYFSAWSSLRAVYGDEVAQKEQASLWKEAGEGKAKVYALFGGQGSNEVRVLRA